MWPLFKTIMSTEEYVLWKILLEQWYQLKTITKQNGEKKYQGRLRYKLPWTNNKKMIVFSLLSQG